MHRDLKLDNLMLKKKEDLSSLKIIDFGIGQFIDQKHWILTKCGSPSYIAPEVFSGKMYTEKCDVFSVGIICYILITEEMPFDAEEMEDVLEQNELSEICYNH